MQFRKRPLTVEAWQWTGNTDHLPAWLLAEAGCKYVEDEVLMIPTPSGVLYADKGDWIILTDRKQILPIKPDRFHSIYEPA